MIRTFGGKLVYVSVISARRPHRVRPMGELIGDATWFVDSESDYEGACMEADQFDIKWDIKIADKLCVARNAALDLAFQGAAAQVDYCLQLSDDLKKLERPVHNGKKFVAQPTTFTDAVCTMLMALEKIPQARLAGVAPTNNPFYYRGKQVHERAFIVGDMMLIKRSSPRFDVNLRLKEDYDFTLKHLDNYGAVARCDDILATFEHRTNKGGAVAYRTPEAEQEAITYLKKRWPHFIVDNPRRPNEILLKVPKIGH